MNQAERPPAPAIHKNMIVWSLIAVLAIALLSIVALLYAQGQNVQSYKKTISALEDQLSSRNIEAQLAPLVKNTGDVSEQVERKRLSYPGITFDGCGALSQYQSTDWYPNLAQHTTLAIKPLVKGSEVDVPLQDVSDACLSNDGNLLIMLFPGGYGGGPTIYTFDTKTYELQRAALIDHGRGWLASPKKFGQRDGNIINLEGKVGDAGAGSTMYYSYFFLDNVIELQKEYNYDAENPDQGTWFYY